MTGIAGLVARRSTMVAVRALALCVAPPPGPARPGSGGSGLRVLRRVVAVGRLHQHLGARRLLGPLDVKRSRPLPALFLQRCLRWRKPINRAAGCPAGPRHRASAGLFLRARQGVRTPIAKALETSGPCRLTFAPPVSGARPNLRGDASASYRAPQRQRAGALAVSRPLESGRAERLRSRRRRARAGSRRGRGPGPGPARAGASWLRPAPRAGARSVDEVGRRRPGGGPAPANLPRRAWARARSSRSATRRRPCESWRACWRRQ